MSSVLKALRQQQAEFAPQHQAIQLEPIQRDKPNLSFWWLVLTVPLAVAIGALAVWLLVPAPTPEEAAKVAVVTQDKPEVRLGQPEPVRVVNLPEVVRETPAVAEEPARQPTVTSNFSEAPAMESNQAVDLNQVSPELLAAFEEAVALTGGNFDASQGTGSSSVLPRLGALSVNIQHQVPSFSYDAHQYSSREGDRFITLNGQRLRQGDNWQNVQVITIAPNHVVLAVGNEAFQQPALEDWTN